MKRTLSAVAVLLVAGTLLLTACGPTGQVRVAQYCDRDGTNCQTVAEREYTATDRFWQIFLLLLLR
jgi:hypothetical protein